MVAERGKFGRPSSSGLLVVNADDWGAEWATTDAILSCFQAGAISSTTACVLSPRRRLPRTACRRACI